MVQKFIEKANIKHKFKFDYSLVEYINSVNKVKIICPEHGEFEQTPAKHLSNGGCRLCGILKRSRNRASNLQLFINKANKIHNNTFDYSLVEYFCNKNKIKIKCNNGHIFEQSPNTHLAGHKCPFCTKKQKLTIQEWFERFNLIHENFFDYSKSVIKNANKKIKII